MCFKKEEATYSQLIEKRRLAENAVVIVGLALLITLLSLPMLGIIHWQVTVPASIIALSACVDMFLRKLVRSGKYKKR